jgi:hypothetical protein
MDVTGSLHRAPAPKKQVAAKEPARRARKPADEADDLVLSPAQLERVKTTLNLTPDQEAMWPAVEAELRAIAKLMPRKSEQKKGAKMKVDPDATDRLKWAAMPLILSFTAEQKRAARELARSMGLDEVASAL